jgi:hypothetical protein
MDYLSLSRGGKFEDAKQPRIGWARYPYTGRSGYECMPTVRSDQRGPFGRNRVATRAVRDAVRAAGCTTPVVLSGGVSTFEQAEELLRAGDADIIASARQSLADPDWFRKLRLGRGDEVRRCVFTNYCEGLDQVHKPVTCKLWDHVDLEGDDTPLTADGRRRLVAPAWEPHQVRGRGGRPRRPHLAILIKRDDPETRSGYGRTGRNTFGFGGVPTRPENAARRIETNEAMAAPRRASREDIEIHYRGFLRGRRGTLGVERKTCWSCSPRAQSLGSGAVAAGHRDFSDCGLPPIRRRDGAASRSRPPISSNPPRLAPPIASSGSAAPAPSAFTFYQAFAPASAHPCVSVCAWRSTCIVREKKLEGSGRRNELRGDGRCWHPAGGGPRCSIWRRFPTVSGMVHSAT